VSSRTPSKSQLSCQGADAEGRVVAGSGSRSSVGLARLGKRTGRGRGTSKRGRVWTPEPATSGKGIPDPGLELAGWAWEWASFRSRHLRRADSKGFPGQGSRKRTEGMRTQRCLASEALA
jgi:hypothetical protein